MAVINSQLNAGEMYQAYSKHLISAGTAGQEDRYLVHQVIVC